MSRNYRFHNPSGLYFVSFATINWIDVFIRECYFQTIIENLEYCISQKGMELFCYCIMPSHIHMIYRTNKIPPGKLLGSFKYATSKQLQNLITENPEESRREWMIEMFTNAGRGKSNATNSQFWQHDNHPIELWSPKVIDQKVDYIHYNPVEAGFVAEPEHWKYSSAVNYSGGSGMVEVSFV